MRSPEPKTIRNNYRAERDATGWSRLLFTLVIATAVLYWAKDVFLPLVMASIISLALSPLAARLEVVIGNVLSAAVIVISLTSVFALLGYFVGIELTSAAADVAGYPENIAAKITNLEHSTPDWFAQVQEGVRDVQRQLGTGSRKSTPHDSTVQSLSASQTAKDLLEPAAVVLSTIGEFLLSIVLIFFLLCSKHEIRDKFVSLMARSEIFIASEAIETAGATVARYLLLLSALNLAYGVLVGIALWLVGLPNPGLWATLAFLLRFIPYVGAFIAGILPTIVAFAVFPGWTSTLLVATLFFVIDQLSVHLAEPFLLGRGMGVSPIALLVSAVYWSWLWGPAGLLLAAPITACLRVAGEYIPALDFFALLLRSNVPPDEP